MNLKILLLTSAIILAGCTTAIQPTVKTTPKTVVNTAKIEPGFNFSFRYGITEKMNSTLLMVPTPRI